MGLEKIARVIRKNIFPVIWGICTVFIVFFRVLGKDIDIFIGYIFLSWISDAVIYSYYSNKLLKILLSQYGTWNNFSAKMKNVYHYNYIPGEYNRQKMHWFINSDIDLGLDEVQSLKQSSKHMSRFSIIMLALTLPLILVYFRP